MNSEQKQLLLKLQQGELDAMLTYKTLAKLADSEDNKNKLLEVAADEGRHASIIKSYTNEVLRPNSEQSEKIEQAYKAHGKNKVFEMLSKGEFDSQPLYQKLSEDFPKFKEIASDEFKHGKIMASFIE